MQSYFLINKDLVLHCDKPHYAFLYFKNHRIDLLTGKKEPFSLAKLDKRLSQTRLNHVYKTPLVFHFFYEWGYQAIGRPDLIGDGSPLVIEIFYQQKKIISHFFDSRGTDKITLTTTKTPSSEHYRKQFQQCAQDLLKGNCYQLNLTCQWMFNLAQKISPLDLWKTLLAKRDFRAPFAHMTELSELGVAFLSNTPECLFKLQSDNESVTVSSYPIKGTIHYDSEKDDFEKLWKKISLNKKEQGELYMIIDLIRNDLSRIERPMAKVIYKKRPLVAPGIIHQMAKISVKLSQQATLKSLLYALFPGGSVTGAPKKMAMQKLYLYEQEDRGFYCGSTLLCLGKRKEASLNIRSTTYRTDLRELSYGAGGGLTLLSRPESEYDEMLLKTQSFLRLFN